MRTGHSKLNPFASFLADAEGAFYEQQVDWGIKDLDSYVAITEKRRYIFDLIQRTKLLAFACDKLAQLPALYMQNYHEKDKNKRAASSIPNMYMTPYDPRSDGARIELEMEGRAMVSLLYYEVTSVVNMIKHLGITIIGNELRFLVKVRNRFIAHPTLHHAVRNSAGSIDVNDNGYFHPHAVYLWDSDSRISEYYSNRHPEFQKLQRFVAKKGNEKLLDKRSEKLSVMEIDRLKVFGLREPNLRVSMDELAAVLDTDVLAYIRTVCSVVMPGGR